MTKMMEQMMAYKVVQEHKAHREVTQMVIDELVLEKLDHVDLIQLTFVDTIDDFVVYLFVPQIMYLFEI